MVRKVMVFSVVSLIVLRLVGADLSFTETDKQNRASAAILFLLGRWKIRSLNCCMYSEVWIKCKFARFNEAVCREVWSVMLTVELWSV